ncbi:polysaccharide deacetylase family protein [Streptomyces uncialis]
MPIHDLHGATAARNKMSTPRKTGNRPRGLRSRAGVAVITLAALGLTTALTGCGTDTEAPSKVRSDAGDDGKGKFGSVDCRKDKCIALTFDAGPHGKHTPRLLDILKKEKVPATFFLLGKKHIDTHPELVRRIDAEGHEIASHTWTHRRLTELDAKEVRWELEHTNKELKKLTGRTPTLMRPPQGRTDEEVNKISKDLGLSEILWTVTAKDYKTTDSALIKRRVLEQSGRDGIILLHDIYDGTVPAVPGIIEELKSRGYTFVTVPQLFAPGVPEPGKVYR